MIVKRSGGNFIPAPSGTWAAVCVDIVDLGMVPGFEGKTQHKIKIVWQIEESRDDGKPHQVSKRYTPSLHEKASLRKDLESWRGRPFTVQELDGFDLENLLGIAALINVIHEPKNGKTYDNVTSIMRLPKGMEAPTARDYVRKCERPNQKEPSPPTYDSETYVPSDDDVPF